MAEDEVWVLRLAVPRHPDDFTAGTFVVDVLTFGPRAPAAAWLAEGCQIRVSGTLDVGQFRSCQEEPDWSVSGPRSVRSRMQFFSL